MIMKFKTCVQKAIIASEWHTYLTLWPRRVSPTELVFFEVVQRRVRPDALYLAKIFGVKEKWCEFRTYQQALSK